MHIQSHFKETRPAVLHELMRAQPLATLAVIQDADIFVEHVPLMVCTDSAGSSVLRGHVPRVSPIWKGFDGVSTKALAIFHGPDSYVSPSWYPSKHKFGKAVPTWNFAVVHAHGYPKAVHDADWLLSHLNELTEWQETGRTIPWKVADAPADYINKMLRHIVGIEMPISSIEGKWKVSQNRPPGDRLGVADALHKQGDENSFAMETLVRQHLDNSDTRT
jgi:transcriptional regulator